LPLRWLPAEQSASQAPSLVSAVFVTVKVAASAEAVKTNIVKIASKVNFIAVGLMFVFCVFIFTFNNRFMLIFVVGGNSSQFAV
jgi:hypothetical protein